MKRAIFPGSFDPITLGHCDIITRNSSFDEIIIAIGENSAKTYMFSLEERKSFIEKTFVGHSKIEVMTYSGLTTDFCKINGFYTKRSKKSSDFEFEKAIAHTNRNIGALKLFSADFCRNLFYIFFDCTCSFNGIIKKWCLQQF